MFQPILGQQVAAGEKHSQEDMMIIASNGDETMLVPESALNSFAGCTIADPQENFDVCRRKFENLRTALDGNVGSGHRDTISMVTAEYEAAFQELVDQNLDGPALWQYFFAGGEFFQHVATLGAIDVSAFSAEHETETLTLFREWEAAEAAVVRLGYRSVPVADWLRSCTSPFAMKTIPVPVFHLLLLKRDAAEHPIVHADLVTLEAAIKAALR
jgi:hypothetical protein